MKHNISFDEFEAYPHPRFLHRAYLGGGPKYTTDWLILPRSPPFPGYQGVLRPRAPSHHRLGLGGGGFQKRYVDKKNHSGIILSEVFTTL